MATLGTFVNRFVGVRELTAVPSAGWTRAQSPCLPPLANEDVYLFVKRIDNGNVLRVANPAANRARSNTMATGFFAAMLIIAGLVPSAYNIMSGFTLQHLRADHAKLQEERAKLDATEAELTSDTRLRALAKNLKMSEPQPEQVQTLGAPVPAQTEKSAVAAVRPQGGISLAAVSFRTADGVATR